MESLYVALETDTQCSVHAVILAIQRPQSGRLGLILGPILEIKRSKSGRLGFILGLHVLWASGML